MRARNIKPGFFKNEELAKLEPHCRLLFIGLWCLADKDGRLEDRPERIRGELFPYEEKLEINRYLTVLSRLGFVIRYRVGELSILQVSNWERHQRPHHTEKSGELPAYIHGVTPLTVNSPLHNGENPPDSLIHRFTDSSEAKASGLVSGEDTSTPKSRTPRIEYRAIAERVIAFLNEKAGRAFQPTDVNLDFIVARLKEGYTEAQLRQVVAKKVREWKGDEVMDSFMRPSTLFNREKFNQYVGELVAPVQEGA